MTGIENEAIKRKISLILFLGSSLMILAVIMISVLLYKMQGSSESVIYSLFIGLVSVSYGIYTKILADRLYSKL